MLLNEIRSPVSDEVRDRFVHIYGTTPALSLKKRLGALYVAKRTQRCSVCGKSSFNRFCSRDCQQTFAQEMDELMGWYNSTIG
jgi:hypothetical protein